MPINKSIIAKNIREERTRRKWSQAKLADKAGLSAQYICQIEKEQKMVSLKAIGRIADALGVSNETLTDNHMESKNPKNYEIDMLFDDCNIYERQVLMELLKSAKKILRENNSVYVELISEREDKF